MDKPIHKYLMEIRHYFSGYEQFVIEAENKADALIKTKEYAEKHICWGGNYDRNSIRCVKKLQN